MTIMAGTWQQAGRNDARIEGKSLYMPHKHKAERETHYLE